MLNSWLDRVLVLLVATTGVLTLLALQYVGSDAPPVQSAAPPAAAASAPSDEGTLPPPVPAPAESPAAPTVTAPPDPGFGFAQAGLNALQAGDAAAAIRWFERATQASPLNAAWRRGLADAYKASGNSLRATEEGLRAWELESGSPETADPSGD